MTDGRTDRQTDGRTDGGDCNIPIAFLKKRGDNNVRNVIYIHDKKYGPQDTALGHPTIYGFPCRRATFY